MLQEDVRRICSRLHAARLGAVMFMFLGSARAQTSNTDARVLVHAALEELATLPSAPPALPGASDSIDPRRKVDTLPRGLQQKKINANTEAARADKGNKSGLSEETLKGKGNASVNSSVNAAAQSAAGQARAAEAKSRAKERGPKDKEQDKPNKP
ncbi:MAG: hypothetical protein ACT4TC_06285 [Myxococcaceae bacterium]